MATHSAIRGDRTLPQVFRRFSFSISRTGRKSSNPPINPPVDSEATQADVLQANATRNVLKFSLRTLSALTNNVPFCAMLSSVIEVLLDIVDRIEQTTTNEHGLTELTARIKRLAPIVADMARKPGQGEPIIAALERELQAIARDWNFAATQGKLDQFFRSTRNACSLASHNLRLSALIADCTLVTLCDVQKSLQTMERPKLAPISAKEHCFGDITGGTGGTGGYAVVGGEGGDGEGPRIIIGTDERWYFGNISGGTGGTGGVGIHVGGRGGTGRAPVISVVRGSRYRRSQEL
ncbi:hypothetical protein C8R43DRAFT_1000642 [Mycena crocata]|nr:hypothetical protein C8R43DRAFT_1000642 [Mycena crocata]